MDTADPVVAAVVLAAGQSQRMGAPKMVLPWGEKTIIAQVVSILMKADIKVIVVVTGGDRQLVESALSGYDVLTVFNPAFSLGGMVKSLQTGISAMSPGVDAALVVLGDQPQIQVELVKKIISIHKIQREKIVLPSFANRRGHPWILPRNYWLEINQMQPHRTMRDFLNTHDREIIYVDAGDDSVLRDIDTPDEYEEQKPG
jgi:molybdenum cofactor cytidylyltransferase